MLTAALPPPHHLHYATITANPRHNGTPFPGLRFEYRRTGCTRYSAKVRAPPIATPSRRKIASAGPWVKQADFGQMYIVCCIPDKLRIQYKLYGVNGPPLGAFPFLGFWRRSSCYISIRLPALLTQTSRTVYFDLLCKFRQARTSVLLRI
jgi:hypothetical protein